MKSLADSASEFQIFTIDPSNVLLNFLSPVMINKRNRAKNRKRYALDGSLDWIWKSYSGCRCRSVCRSCKPLNAMA